MLNARGGSIDGRPRGASREAPRLGYNMDVRDELMEHVPRLRRYARALINNRDLADDLVQDTLERALRHTEKFQTGTDLRAWLFTIMHNVFANQARRAGVKAVHISVDDENISEREFAVPGTQTQSLEVRDLDFALQRLPLDQRQVVLLVGLEEMSYADVAQALEIPIGTVMSRLSRGRERLRALMAGAQPGAKLQVVR
jgi:RNA polymerase sigma-70 factor (ECF subfamily)